MTIPRYQGLESIPEIVEWFCNNEPELIDNVWSSDRAIQILSDSLIKTFSTLDRNSIRDHFNFVYHQLTGFIIPELKKMDSNPYKDTTYFKNLLGIFVWCKAQYIIGTWIYEQHYQDNFNPYGDPFDVIGLSNGFEDYYQILDVSPSATFEEIKQAFRKAVKQKHPDVGGDPELFKKITKAYEVLSNANRRENYDEIHQLYYEMKTWNSAKWYTQHMDSNEPLYNSDKASENKDRVTDDQTTNTFHNNKTEFETKKSFRPGFAFFAGIVVGVFIVTIGLLYNDHLSLQSSDAVSSEFDSIQGFSYNEEFPNNVSVENNLEEVIPTEIEAIEAINQANYLYSHRYGFVPDHIAEQEEKESLKAIIESFPEEWPVGLMIVRSQSSYGILGVDYFPVIKTQTGYLFADYYLKGVEINKVSWDTVYGYDQYPISNAEKEPIVIWRSSETWNTYQDLIWEDYFWLYDDYTLLPDFDHVFLD